MSCKAKWSVAERSFATWRFPDTITPELLLNLFFTTIPGAIIMIVLTYYEFYKNMKNIFDFRYKMVKFALEHSISEAAREFSTTRKTVRKWVKRFNESGFKGLNDRSKAPINPHGKTSIEIENKILEIRKIYPYKGPYRIVEEHGIEEVSYSTVARILKRKGLVKHKKKKHETKRDLRKVKEKLKSFEKIQIDIKYLDDIPKYFPYYKVHNFPRYQFSARDVRTGIAFVCYGYEKSSTNMGLFLLMLIHHLKTNGVDLKDVEFQSDNGTEFIGSPKAKIKNKTLYLKIAEKFGLTTSLIPPARPTFNSDVEAFHSLIETEFYEQEDYSDLADFLNKSFTYMTYFNVRRIFRYKFNKKPIEILINDRNISFNNALKLSLFYPIILDYLFLYYFSSLSGYHLMRSDTIFNALS